MLSLVGLVFIVWTLVYQVQQFLLLQLHAFQLNLVPLDILAQFHQRHRKIAVYWKKLRAALIDPSLLGYIDRTGIIMVAMHFATVARSPFFNVLRAQYCAQILFLPLIQGHPQCVVPRPARPILGVDHLAA